MLYGIGCDLCSIDRMQKILTSAHGMTFARRVFGEAERTALGLLEGSPFPEGRAGQRTAASASADFAAKEAFLKAAGTGLAGAFSLCEIESIRLPSGAPEYRFSGRTAAWVAERHLKAHLSLSHDNGMALAFCVLEQNTER